jgi:hypothetical protein
MMTMTLPHPCDVWEIAPLGNAVVRRARMLVVGIGVPWWCEQVRRVEPTIDIVPISWPMTTFVAADPALAMLPPAGELFDHIQVQFLHLFLPHGMWRLVLGALCEHLQPEGEIAILDSGIIPTFLPGSSLAMIEVMTAHYADVAQVGPFASEQVCGILAQTPGIMPSSIATTNHQVPVGPNADSRGRAMADLWLEQRLLLFPEFARLGMLLGGERAAASLSREVHHAIRSLPRPVRWRWTMTRAHIAPIWNGDVPPWRMW